MKVGVSFVAEMVLFAMRGKLAIIAENIYWRSLLISPIIGTTIGAYNSAKIPAKDYKERLLITGLNMGTGMVIGGLLGATSPIIMSSAIVGTGIYIYNKK